MDGHLSALLVDRVEWNLWFCGLTLCQEKLHTLALSRTTSYPTHLKITPTHANKINGTNSSSWNFLQFLMEFLFFPSEIVMKLLVL